MKKFDGHWYPLYHNDFDRSVAGWSAERVGAYILLLNHQWQNNGIPKDREELIFIARCSDVVLEKVLTKFSTEKNERLFNKKMEEIRVEQKIKYEKRANAGKAGGIASSNAKAMLKQSSSNAKAKGVAKAKQSEIELDIENSIIPKEVDSKLSTKKFVKPEFRELANFMFIYANEQKINPTKDYIAEQANLFLDHYNSNGWKVGKVPMKDWQAAASGWIRRNNSQNKTNEVKTLSRAERADQLKNG